MAFERQMIKERGKDGQNYDEKGYPVIYIDGKYAVVEYSYDANGYIEDRGYKNRGEVERYPL